MAGVSRSVTLVLAYLMKHHQMSLREAISTIRKRRKIVLLILLLDKSKSRVFKATLGILETLRKVKKSKGKSL